MSSTSDCKTKVREVRRMQDFTGPFVLQIIGVWANCPNSKGHHVQTSEAYFSAFDKFWPTPLFVPWSVRISFGILEDYFEAEWCFWEGWRIHQMKFTRCHTPHANSTTNAWPIQIGHKPAPVFFLNLNALLHYELHGKAIPYRSLGPTTGSSLVWVSCIPQYNLLNKQKNRARRVQCWTDHQLFSLGQRHVFALLQKEIPERNSPEGWENRALPTLCIFLMWS